MAEWSQLPKELLPLISQRLEICFDFIHFRSVCSSWRSSVPPKLCLLPASFPLTVSPRPCLLPANFPLTPFDDRSITFFRLSKRIIVLIRLSENHNQAAPNRWLVKVEEDKHKRIHLLNPFSNSSIKGSKVLDLLNCHVIEFSREYVLHFHVYHPHPLQHINRNFQHKVAFMWSSTQKNDYVLLTFYRYRYLAMLRSTDKQWIVLENMPRPCRDIISFNGKFYALVEEGRTMVVEPSSNVSFLAHFGSRNSSSKKFFVESSGHLLLVESGLLINHGTERSMQQGWRSPLKMIWFKVYKLNEAGQKWDDVKSLGDRVLIWGNHGSFSASASELSLSKGNYIVFGMRRFDWNYEQFCDVEFSDMYVFNYENGSVKPLRKHPDFFKLFRPPRDWVTSTTQ